MQRQDLGGRRSDYVAMDTEFGTIVVEIFTGEAPITAANFLKYVRRGFYEQACFYRSARPDNDPYSYQIRVIQGGLGLQYERSPPLSPIVHESTQATGLRHLDGSLSMVRWATGSAGSEFFIVVGDTPALDFGGALNPDMQGYAVFGRVIVGMDVVRRINSSPTGTISDVEHMREQALLAPVNLRVRMSRNPAGAVD